ncbi:hypothetical protein, partial [Geminocystis sp. GBBB08]|uniref:hypothetical protein n=1 Tax=Geminocystis sp. GBBB08 TaxID=2604140 RepID=UPI0027E3601B
GKEQLIYTENNLILQFLRKYLPQFEKKGLTYLSILNVAKIPKTDDDLTQLFQEYDRLKREINYLIKNIRKIYLELDEMVKNLYHD